MSSETASAPRPRAGIWELEPAHTTVGFVGRHLGLSKVRGRFTDFKATIEVADDLEDSSVEAWIDAASVESGVQMRDDHLRSPDFLDVEQFPQIHFVSTGVSHLEGDMWQVAGDLTIRDVTRPVTLDVEFIGAIDDPNFQTQRAGLVATTEIDRTDFGMEWNMPLGLGGLVGKKGQIEIDAEVIRQPYVDPFAGGA